MTKSLIFDLVIKKSSSPKTSSKTIKAHRRNNNVHPPVPIPWALTLLITMRSSMVLSAHRSLDRAMRHFEFGVYFDMFPITPLDLRTYPSYSTTIREFYNIGFSE